MTTALFFPGQGSQSVGMLGELADEFGIIKETFAQASDALGYDVWELVQQDPNNQLNETQFTQPALLTASVALYRVAKDKGLGDDLVMAGHSLGEYSALVCAGAIDFKDAVKLVEARGKFMQEAVADGEGAMAAVIGLDDDVIKQICEEQAQGEVVTPVNYNSPGQVVIAGHASAVSRAGEALKEAGAKRVLPLPVSVPSHCALMKPAAEKLKQELESITVKSPVIEVINNVDVMVETDPAAIKDALVRQLYCPVRWTESVEKAANMSVEKAFEVGPGKVLTGLNKRITKSFNCSALNTAEALNSI
ncbi:malonyl CoA-ACP transacylase [Idiomarina sp. WRN-38]|uniref:ACP S-malonyltransferase n=1 Tax=Idiomarina sp. OXR-189 TaxID=3100175 RepID=UPI00073357A2|nr:ACP S-malonyltransferase [Idiomarina sp. OXR-189]KTG23679.1 malonyl CoA-ACP transacylase [Idiomarina sp. H105]OAE91071.1 malonyl CoA-ACP transacylase [Idiomarina sp. WRN-38]WPZ00247.1 ACP S-malonyltransferase [Idiomarina sp. OXR-189]